MRSLFELAQEQSRTLEWCDECNKWHQSGSLTICALRRARDIMMEKPEKRGPFVPNPDRPWKRVQQNG